MYIYTCRKIKLKKMYEVREIGHVRVHILKF